MDKDKRLSIFYDIGAIGTDILQHVLTLLTLDGCMHSGRCGMHRLQGTVFTSAESALLTIRLQR